MSTSMYKFWDLMSVGIMIGGGDDLRRENAVGGGMCVMVRGG